MTPIELLERLRPLRLPAAYVQPTFGDHLVSFCLGLVAALAIFVVLSPFLRRRVPLPARIARELDALKGLPAADRFAAQARLFASLAGHDAVSRADWRDALYANTAPPDSETLDRDIIALARKRRRHA
jgi:hypothetical protein